VTRQLQRQLVEILICTHLAAACGGGIFLWSLFSFGSYGYLPALYVGAVIVIAAALGGLLPPFLLGPAWAFALAMLLLPFSDGHIFAGMALGGSIPAFILRTLWWWFPPRDEPFVDLHAARARALVQFLERHAENRRGSGD
jgi:hypothetical protein